LPILHQFEGNPSVEKGFCIFDEMAVMIVDISIGIRDGMVAITIDGHVEGGDYFSHGCGGYDKSKISKGGGNWLVIGQEIGEGRVG